MSGIEIYVRHRSEGAVLSFHLSSDEREALIHALMNGSIDEASVPVHLELSVLPQWLIDPEHMHARIPISAINVNIDE